MYFLVLKGESNKLLIVNAHVIKNYYKKGNDVKDSFCNILDQFSDYDTILAPGDSNAKINGQIPSGQKWVNITYLSCSTLMALELYNSQRQNLTVKNISYRKRVIPEYK